MHSVFFQRAEISNSRFACGSAGEDRSKNVL